MRGGAGSSECDVFSAGVTDAMSFLRKGILVAGGQVVGVMLTMVVGVINSRTLGPDGMGQYELCRSFLFTAGLALALGIGPANIYFINNRKIPIEVITTNAVKGVLVSSVVIALAAALAIYSFPNYFGEIPLPAIIMLGVGVASHSSGIVLRPILIARMEARRLVVADMASGVVLLCGAAFLAAGGWLTTPWALIVLSMSFCSRVFLLIFFLRKQIDLTFRFRWDLLWGVLGYGLQLGAAAVLVGLTGNLTVMLFRYLRPGAFDEIGLYGRAVAVSSLILLVPLALAPLLYAKFAGTEGLERSRQAEMVLRTNVLYGLVTALVVALLGKYFIWILYGAEFLAAQKALVFLAPALFMVPIISVCTSLLAGGGRPMTRVYVAGGTLVVTAGVVYLLVPVWGMCGAAAGVLVGNVFAALTLMAVCRKLFNLNLYRCLIPQRDDVRYIRNALKG
jgi:O-antigen/teichoic acid export membrane protein